jgi:hypothetical protein
MRRTTSAQWPYSVCSDFRNLRRAGVLKYRSCTSMVVPRAPDDGATVPWCEPTISQACGRVGRARGERDGGHRGDRGQRLAAEAEGADVFEVGQRGDLRGGVARQRERQLLGRDAAAVVGDGDALDAAFLQPDGDLGGAGVERVFQQLLDHGRRPLDHLAGGDLRNELVRQGWMGRWVGAGAFMLVDYSLRRRCTPQTAAGGVRGQSPFRLGLVFWMLAHRDRRVAQVDVVGRILVPRAAAVALRVDHGLVGGASVRITSRWLRSASGTSAATAPS